MTPLSLRRCLDGYGINRLPEFGGDKPRTQRFTTLVIGYVQSNSAEIIPADGELRPFVAIDQTSRFSFMRWVQKAAEMEGHLIRT